MWFWWELSFYSLFIPITMWMAGRLMQTHCPKQNNRFVGYRTLRSRKNMDTWRFAHDYCGRLWQKLGAMMLSISIFVQISFVHQDRETLERMRTILIATQCIVLILSAFATERALKKNFSPDGTRREEAGMMEN